MSEITLRDLLQKLAEERRLDFRGYKPSTLERRIRHRLQQLRIASYGEYLARIEEHPDEVKELLNTILINVTEFFRDPPVWQLLETKILPELRDAAPPGSVFRVWSSACASGEEAYSLAMLVNEVFRDRMKDCEVKVYGTDADEQALVAARRGEYPADALRKIRPEWREKYFTGESVCRINQEIRRLCIFGRNNLTTDAPISRVRLLMCRNTLIYFDGELQKQVLARFHYALQPGGVLVLGRSESTLAQSKIFRALDAKWRIFQRVDLSGPPFSDLLQHGGQEGSIVSKMGHNYELLKLYHDSLLQVLEPGVLVLDPKNVVITENEAALRHLGLGEQKLTGQALPESALASHCPDLLEQIEKHLGTNEGSRFEYTFTGRGHGDPAVIAVTIKPIVTPKGGKAGTLIYLEDVSPRHHLQSTVTALQSAGEELQSSNEELESSNEELETTNEELQSTNEELETTNEELQSANEELQVLNEELGTSNEELGVRTRELDTANRRYMGTLERVPWPVMLVNSESRVEFWNPASQELFGLDARSVIGLEVRQLPVPETLRRLLAKQVRVAAAGGKPRTTFNFYLESGSYSGPLDIRFTPLPEEPGNIAGVLVLFESHEGGKAESQVSRRRSVLTRRAASSKMRKKSKMGSNKRKSSARKPPRRNG